MTQVHVVNLHQNTSIHAFHFILHIFRIHWALSITFNTFFSFYSHFFTVRTVKITKLSVPSQYILNAHKPEHLVLDCEYEIEPHEKGLVLKWFLNSQPVYQWIPARQPFGLKGFKNRVNTTYSVSAEHLHKYRAMAVTKPMWNHTGEYSCWVQTFESNDRKTANVTVIGIYFSCSFISSFMCLRLISRRTIILWQNKKFSGKTHREANIGLFVTFEYFSFWYKFPERLDWIKPDTHL